ncbi:MAG: hypothetical protein L3J21_09745 [Devosiaceae bacterium]|nr:hypothetical protein [Devosiaceae bacterium]
MYLIKYAQTKGIEKVKVRARDNSYTPALIEVVNYVGYFRLGRDIVETKEEALLSASIILERKIEYLKKQLKKYENFEIIIPD